MTLKANHNISSGLGRGLGILFRILCSRVGLCLLLAAFSYTSFSLLQQSRPLTEVTIRSQRDVFREVGSDMAKQFTGNYDDASFEAEAAAETLAEIRKNFPGFELYLVDHVGVIRASLINKFDLHLPAISLFPINNFIGNALPDSAMYAEDPHDLPVRRAFTAGALKIGTEDFFIFAIVVGPDPYSSIGQFRNNYKSQLRLMFYGLGFPVLFCFVLFLFPRLRRGLRNGIYSLKSIFIPRVPKSTLPIVPPAPTLTKEQRALMESLHLEVATIPELLERSVSKFQAMARSRALQLEFVRTPGLPAIPIDRKMIETVCSVILGRALNESVEGKAIKVSSFLADAGVGFLVTWEAQRQGPAPVVNDEGLTLLGFSMCRQIVDAHNGKFTLHRDNSTGHVFAEVRLPNAASHSRAA